jgi:hypothetical protein
MFEDWAKVMGGILQNAGINGFLGNLEEFYEESDADGAMWRAFVRAWCESFGTTEKTVAELWPVATDDQILDLGDKSDQSQKIRLGKILAQARDRVFTVNLDGQQESLRIKRGDTLQGARNWKLAKTKR